MLIPDTLLDLITKTILKLDTFGKFSICIVSVMSIVLRQLSKLRSILTHRLVALLEFQELNLLLAPNIFRKVSPQKRSPEHSPSQCNTILLHFSPGSNPPVISFLCQH